MFIVWVGVNSSMLYHFELMMAGVILLSAMVAGGVAIWHRKRKERTLNETEDSASDYQ